MEKGITEYETVRRHHQLNGHEFEWTPGVGDGQGGLGRSSPWDSKELDMTERLSMHAFNLCSVLKSRDITLLIKVHLVKAMVFPAVMYGCESWTIKKAECQRIDIFALWCWRKTLESPLDYKVKPVNPKGNQL